MENGKVEINNRVPHTRILLDTALMKYTRCVKRFISLGQEKNVNILYLENTDLYNTNVFQIGMKGCKPFDVFGILAEEIICCNNKTVREQLGAQFMMRLSAYSS